MSSFSGRELFVPKLSLFAELGHFVVAAVRSCALSHLLQLLPRRPVPHNPEHILKAHSPEGLPSVFVAELLHADQDLWPLGKGSFQRGILQVLG